MTDRSPFDLAALPGVRLRSRRLLRDLAEGRSCLWLLPEQLVAAPDNNAERLLDELLNELGDFLMVPSAEHRPAARRTPSPAPAGPPGGSWPGLEPLLDYDDGLSLFGSPGVPAAPAPPPSWSAPGPPPAPDGTELTDRLAKELPGGEASPAGAGTRADEVLRRLIGAVAEPGGNRVVIVRAWSEPSPAAATDLLRQLAAAVKAAGLPPADRPRMLVVAVPSRLPRGLPEQLAREDVAVHWWWGALGRLDTATVVSMLRPETGSTGERGRLLEDVAQATAVEVCGPFLDLAAALAADWDGNPESLVDRLCRLIGSTADGRVPPPREEPPRGSGTHPEHFLRADWDLGLVQLWGGQLRRHPGCELGREDLIRKRVWLAQNHALLPLLDDAREAFTEVVRARTRIPLARMAAEYGPHPAGGHGSAARDERLTGMELGDMWGAHCNSHVRLTRTEADRLRLLWTARNLLAHRTPLDAPTLRRLATELCRR